ncbi:MAG: diguanylate cyclase [Peptococcaceae bacterium]|nr:diguanylate cyclase [Peptococcaceae bacterium]
MESDFKETLYAKLDALSSRSIIETLPDGALVLDEDGKAIFANPKFCELTGYTLADLMYLSHEELVKLLLRYGEKVYPSIRDNLHITESGERTSARRIFLHKMGYSVPIEVSGYVVRDRDGQTHGTLLVCKDLHSQLMAEIISTINSSLQIKDVLQNTTKAVVDYLGLYSNAVFMFDKAINALRLVSCNVFEAETDLPDIIIPLGVGAPGKIALTRKAVYVANLGEEELTSDAKMGKGVAKFKGRSSIGYPLLFRDELLGVIAFDAATVREFSDEEKLVFESVANQVALAMYNAQLFANLEHLSITDGMTSLYNHRYFQDRLIEELNRAKRNHAVISLLMLDIDNFKNYNDHFGHPRGDQLLKGFSGLIKASVRNFDVVCRYGGEEFAVILPDCQQTEAIEIAERIRKACERFNFFGRETQPGGRVTVSIGVANYPQAKTHEEIVLFADKALYAAKHHNRNRVEIYS